MNPFSIAIAGILFVIGLWVGRTTTSFPLPQLPVQPTSTLAPSPESTPPEASASANPEPTKPLAPKSPTSTPNPTTAPTRTNLELLIYPQSSIKQSAATQIVASSSDEPEQITTWYKEKLSALGFRSTSVAKTNTNDRIEHKVAGGKAGEQLTITITRQPGSSEATIRIEATSTDGDSSSVRINNTQ